MRRADRLFELVQTLRNRRFATAQQLADHLEVSRRTVYRDVRDLQTSGVPIIGEAGVGYQLERGYELPPLTFNTEEIEALVLGTRLVEVWGDASLAAAARRALTKVEAVLPTTLREVLVGTHLFGPKWFDRPPPHLQILRRTVADRRKVCFGYTRADDTPSERVVRPLGLYFWGRVWSLASWCELREDFRNFRVDRMRDVTALEETFDVDGGISLDGFIAAMDSQ